MVRKLLSQVINVRSTWMLSRMSEIPFVELIGNFGFPIFFCLLVYLDLRKKVDRLIEVMEVLCDRVRDN